MSGPVRHGQWSFWGACLRGPGGGAIRGRPLFSEEADISLVGKISIGDQGSAFVCGDLVACCWDYSGQKPGHESYCFYFAAIKGEQGIKM